MSVQKASSLCEKFSKIHYMKYCGNQVLDPHQCYSIRELSQITFALGVGRWSEKRKVYYIKSAI